MMHVEYRSVVHDAASQPESGRVAFFGGLARLASGLWLCGFTVGRTKHDPQGTIRICRSADDGRSWQPVPWSFESRLGGTPGSLAGAEMVEASPGRLLVFTTWFDRSDPDRPLFDPQTEGILPSRLVVAESSDEGLTWGEWRVVPTPGLTGTAVTGPVLKWDDGSIGFAFESFKEFDDPSPPTHGAWLVVSRDGGRSFGPPVLVARDPRNQVYFWDQRLCTGPAPGEYVGLFWTHDRAEKRDRHVHLKIGHLTSLANPNELPVETSIRGQIAAPLRLPDGRLLAFVVDRARPGTLRLWSSLDGGSTWPAESSLVVHGHDEQARLSCGLLNIDFAQYWEDMARWSFGHPALRLLDQERVLVTYYAGTPGCLSVHSAAVNLA